MALVTVKVNPDIPSRKVTISIGELDSNGNYIYYNFEKFKIYTVDEIFLTATDSEGRSLLVLAVESDATPIPVSPSGVQLEEIRDDVAGMFQHTDHTNVSVTYNDAANRVIIDATGGSTVSDEQIQDAAALLLDHSGHTNVTASYDDANNRVVLSASGGSTMTDEQAQDAVAPLFTHNGHTNLTATYDDALNRVILAASGSSSSSAGTMTGVYNAVVDGGVTAFTTYDAAMAQTAAQVTAQTTAISNAMDAANTAGKPLYFPSGFYRSNSIQKSYSLTILGDYATILNNKTSGWMWTFQGTMGSAVNLTADAPENSRTLNVPSGTLSVGDIITVCAEPLVASNISWAKVGQAVRVASIVSSSQITVTEPLYRTFLTSETAHIRRWSPIENMAVQGMKFDNPLVTDSTTNGGFLAINVSRRTRIQMEGARAGNAGVYMVNAYDFEVLSDAREYSSAGTRDTYCVQVQSACAHGRVWTKSINGVNGFTTGGSSGYTYGEPYDMDIYAHVVNSATIGVGTHEMGHDIRIINPFIHSSALSGITMRCKNVTIFGGLIIDSGGEGINIQNLGGFAPKIINTVIRGGSSRGIMFASTNMTHVYDAEMRGNTIENNALAGIQFAVPSTDTQIVDNVFKNMGVGAAANSTRAILHSAGIATRMHIAWNKVMDNQATRTTIALLTPNSGTNVGCTVWQNHAHNGVVIVNGTATGVDQQGNLVSA